MELNQKINLSKKHKKAFDVFPYFFSPTLNNLYYLQTERGFTKPKLSTWRDEAVVEFTKQDNRVLIQYLWPNFIEVRIGKKGQPRKNDFVLNNKFKNIGEKSVSDLPQMLEDYLISILVSINSELGKFT